MGRIKGPLKIFQRWRKKAKKDKETQAVIEEADRQGVPVFGGFSKKPRGSRKLAQAFKEIASYKREVQEWLERTGQTGRQLFNRRVYFEKLLVFGTREQRNKVLRELEEVDFPATDKQMLKKLTEKVSELEKNGQIEGVRKFIEGFEARVKAEPSWEKINDL